LNGSSLALVPKNASGDSIAALTFSGTLTPTDSAYLSRSSTQDEATRIGNHTFSVAEVATLSGEFTPLVQTAPGTGLEVDLLARGTQTFTFHDGGPAGAVFTTCIVADSIAGGKTSN